MVYKRVHSHMPTPTLSFVNLRKLGQTDRQQQQTSHFSNFYDLDANGAY